MESLPSFFTYTVNLTDGVQMGQEILHCAPLHDAAGVVYIPLPKAGHCEGSPECHFLKELMHRSGTAAETGEPVAAPSCWAKNSPS